MYQDLELTATKIREDIITMLLAAGSGHSAGPLGMADIFTALYFKVLNINPKEPLWAERDRVVLSNAHICPVWYATLARRGFFPLKELNTLRAFGTRLQGHSTQIHGLPGIENSGGPLGQGISVAVGMALAGRMNNSAHRVYCLMGDGELNEGQCWEAFMLAAKLKLANLTVIVDRNNIQIDGPTESVMPLEPLADKFRAFDFNVLEINGHDFHDIISACGQAAATSNLPTVIIARTIPGRGVDFMEYDYKWHGIPPNAEQGKMALDELRTLQGKIESEHE